MAINIVQTPAPGTLVLDANNTVIKVQSTNGAGYYFRALIYVGGVLFDEQAWSRSDDYTAAADLKKLYSSYFETVFNPAFANLLAEQTHLIREVSITVQEYRLDTGALVQTLVLPVFSIMYNVKPVGFNANTLVSLLGVDTKVMRVPLDGKIALPFYLGAAARTVNVTLTDSADNILDIRNVTVATGQKVYMYQFDLSGASLGYDSTGVTVTITVNDTSLVQQYRIIRLPFYEVKQLVFCNNFGYYLYAYFTGQLKIENTFSPETDVLADEREIISEINEDATYTLHTGVLRESEGGIVNMVANSPDTRLYQGGAWLTLVTDTKKQTEHQDKLHQYGESLTFTIRKGTDIDNENYIYTSPLPNIVIESVVENPPRNYTVNYRLNNGYYPASGYLKFYVKQGGQPFHSTLNFAPSTPTGSVYIVTNQSVIMKFYLQDYGDSSIISNTVTA